MPGTSRAGAYRDALADRRLVRVFALALVGRFGYAMFALCLLFTIAHASTFTTAATSLAAFGLSGLAMPGQARLLDRYGQRVVLPAVGTCFVIILILIAASGAHGVRQAGVWIGICLFAGLFAPSLGPSMRAQWRAALTLEQRPAGYSLDAVAEEVVFFLGPIAASVLLAVGPAWWGIAAIAVLMPVGFLGLALSPFAPSGSNEPAGQGIRLGPLHRAPFRRLLLTMALAGAALGGTFTTVAALADQSHHPSATGIIEAAGGILSVAAGLAWVSAERPWHQQLALLLAARIPLLVGCALLPNLWCVGVFVALSAAAVSPVYIVGLTAGDQLTQPHEHTEAGTWVTSAGNIGSSGGTALTGWLAAQVSIPAAFAAIAVGLTAGTLLGLGRPAR